MPCRFASFFCFSLLLAAVMPVAAQDDNPSEKAANATDLA